MNVLVTGISGYVGSLVSARLRRDGHAVRGLSRHPERVDLDVPVAPGDAITGEGLRRALAGVEVAYFLIHSMEPAGIDRAGGPFSDRDRAAAQGFARAARDAGVRRIVYLGGPVPSDGAASAHLRSRLEVERILLEAVPGSVALRASIVIGARSSPFRFLVRLVERLPVVPLLQWRGNRTAPIDERDIVEMLVRSADSDLVAGRALDAAGPDTVSYGELIARIADVMLVDRPTIGLRRLDVTPIASRAAAVVAGAQPELIGPLMESLRTDLLPGDQLAAPALAIRLHSLTSAIEHALREWERTEPLAAR